MEAKESHLGVSEWLDRRSSPPATLSETAGSVVG
mgnify:FL=1